MIQTNQQTTAQGSTSRRSPALLIVCLSILGVGTLWRGLILARAMDNFVIGDWLINYSGGFVRRGLMGTLVLFLGRATHVPLGSIVYLLQSAALLVFLLCAFWLARGIRWSYLLVAVVLSPASVIFWLAHPYIGMRKEILLFAALALTMRIPIPERSRQWQLSLWLSIIAIVLILSHEALAVCLPYFFAVVAIKQGSLRRAVETCWPAAFVSGIALAAVAMHPGDFAIAQAICSSVGGGTLKPSDAPSQNLCGGAIEWLKFSAPEARQRFWSAVLTQRFFFWYGLAVLPAFAPAALELLWFYRRGRARREARIVALCASVSLVGLVMLCFIAVDWGRWIHMQVVCLTLMVLFVVKTVPAAEGPPPPPRPWMVRFASVLAVLIYAIAWTIPLNDPHRGHAFIGLFGSAIHFIHHYRDAP
jgi:hypothetical protein